MFRPLAIFLVSVSMASAETPIDDRLTQLRQFFRQKGAPVEHLAEEFLAAADRHSLDWRLLPSLAIIETAGLPMFREIPYELMTRFAVDD